MNWCRGPLSSREVLRPTMLFVVRGHKDEKRYFDLQHPQLTAQSNRARAEKWKGPIISKPESTLDPVFRVPSR